MKKVAELHPEKMLDLLNERLTFERTSVKLYDTVLGKMHACRSPGIGAILPQMQRQRAQEREHVEWLEMTIRELGDVPGASNEMSELARRELESVAAVIEKDEEIHHLFHAMLTAELADDTGWKLLMLLAYEAEDADARRELRRRSREEEEHVIFVRSVVAAFARQEVLGKAVQMPLSH
jgi:bacterioferritin (cytochrome b1)